MNPFPDTPEFATAANAGLPLGEMVALDRSDARRFREAYEHATAVEGYDADAGRVEPIDPIPCYVCGFRASQQVCLFCCRNLCNECVRAGGHSLEARRCDFIVPGRSPDLTPAGRAADCILGRS